MNQNDFPAKPENSDPTFEEDSKMRPTTVLFEFFDFMRHNQKWWLTPIVLVLLLLSVFIGLTNTAIGPFIYVLF